MVHMCLGVTYHCHLLFRWIDWDLLPVTAVTWGWNGYLNKSQHKKLNLEKKILLLLQLGLKPEIFQSLV